MSPTPARVLSDALHRAQRIDRGDLGPRFRIQEGARQAAILMLFGPAVDDGADVTSPEELDVVLEVRADTLRKHPGEVAFPGGARDPEDSDIIAAALREAREEIGLTPTDAHVLGTLPETGTVSAFRVTPVVAWRTRPVTYFPVDSAETAAVHRVQVADLLDPAHRFTTVFRHPTGAFRGPGFAIPGATVWGFTAFVLDEFFSAAGWTKPWPRDREVDITRA